MTRGGTLRCEEVVADLLAYLDGEIDAARRSLIDRHLEECHGCCSRAVFERALRKKVTELGEEKASASLRRRVRALIRDF
jgi:mycothiol system anti-sigma-R factor